MPLADGRALGDIVRPLLEGFVCGHECGVSDSAVAAKREDLCIRTVHVPIETLAWKASATALMETLDPLSVH